MNAVRMFNTGKQEVSAENRRSSTESEMIGKLFLRDSVLIKMESKVIKILYLYLSFLCLVL